MVSGCLLAVTAGLGAAALLRWRPRARWMLPLLSVAVLADGWIVAPMPVNGWNPADRGLLGPPRQVLTGRSTPGVYVAAAKLPAGSVLVEIPLGDWLWDYQATFYASVHWHPLLNGASGHVPPWYPDWAPILAHPADDEGGAWQILRGAGVTHVVLHRDAYVPDEATRILDWLARRGARVLWTDGRDDLLELRLE